VSGEKPREIAAGVLHAAAGVSPASQHGSRVPRRSRQEEFVENLLEQALANSHLSGPDRRLCQELVYGVVRRRATLDWLIARKAQNPVQKRALQDLLRLGLYQIFFLDRIPNHAAVHETVAMAKRAGFGPQSGFINAMLRGYLREFDATKAALEQLKTTQPHLGYSHPEWLVNRWRERWGAQKTAQLLAWNNTPPDTFARINTLKADPGKLLTQWRDENVEYDFVRRDWLEENLVFKFKSHPPLERLPSFRQGLFYIQDPSTLLAVRELDPQPGQTVLDLCAAPGGKLTYIAQLMRNEGRIVAHDLSPERLKLVQENCARLGVTCVLPLPLGEGRPALRSLGEGGGQGNSSAPVVGMPSALRSLGGGGSPASQILTVRSGTAGTPSLPGSFDSILVDAPCSNTGVMPRRVELRWRLRPEEIDRLRTVQLDLLNQASPLLKPGGVLVYSTCSLEPQENRQVVDEFLTGHTEFKLEHDHELLPFVDGVDGAYMARLIMKAE
jgi:16S rRNA (cytosine967-C5)-methyltransferase